MLRSRDVRTLLGCVLLLVGVGCSHSSPPPTAAGHTGKRNADKLLELAPASAGTSGESCSLRAVYFDTDDAQLNEESRNVISDAVRCYSHGNMPAKLLLTGAADPRGSEEYNLAIGERRARAVEQFLVMLGVARERISVHSAGEEQAVGSDESSWRMDRHVVATNP